MNDGSRTDDFGSKWSLVNDSQHVQGPLKEEEDAVTRNNPSANNTSGGYESSDPYSQDGQPLPFQSSEEGRRKPLDSGSVVSPSVSGNDLSEEREVDEGTIWRREGGSERGPIRYDQGRETRVGDDGRLGAPTRYTR